MQMTFRTPVTPPKVEIWSLWCLRRGVHSTWPLGRLSVSFQTSSHGTSNSLIMVGSLSAFKDSSFSLSLNYKVLSEKNTGSLLTRLVLSAVTWKPNLSKWKKMLEVMYPASSFKNLKKITFWYILPNEMTLKLEARKLVHDPSIHWLTLHCLPGLQSIQCLAVRILKD